MFTISGDSETQSGWCPVLFVETYNNGPHDITLLEVSFWAGGMSIMAGDAGIRDGEVSRSLASICSTGRLKTTSIVVGPKGVAVSHTRGNGTALYWLACQLDREGIVAKRANSRHEGRGGDLFKRAR